MPEAVLVSALRTPVGTAVKGTLRDTTAFDLAHHIVAAAAVTDDLDPDAIDDVILGEGLYGGGVVARHAALTVGLTSVPGLAHNRHCAAGLAAVQSAAASIRAGMDELVIAGGVNSASTSPKQRFRVEGSGSNHGARPRTPTGLTPPTWTCRSRSAGTPPCGRASAAPTWTPGPCAPTGTPFAPSTKAVSTPSWCPSTHRTDCSPSTNTPAAPPAWRSSPPSSRSTRR